MNISRLIEQLKQAQIKYGDVRCCIANSETDALENIDTVFSVQVGDEFMVELSS